MIITNTEKEYCMECGNENPQDREICECGGRNFIFGNKFTFAIMSNGMAKVNCGCGNNYFTKVSHVII